MTATTSPTGSPRSIRVTVLLLFVASGFCGLVYEVVWVRSLMTVFGVSAYAISTVLASFMGGIALGSFLVGRYIDRHPRPLLVYAALEVGIAAYALAVPLLFRLADESLRLAYGILPSGSYGLLALVRVVLAFAILVVPTTLMGATLPVLSKFFVERLDHVGREMGRLYFLNTMGAVAGCAAAGFLLIPRLGLLRSTWVAAALNGIIALVAFTLQRATSAGAVAGAPLPRNRKPSNAEEGAAGAERRRRLDARTRVVVAIAATGICALGFEVIWSRLLVLVFGSTVYSFSVMLSVFLLGLALGSALFSRVADRSARAHTWLAFLMIGVAFVVLAEIAVLDQLPLLFLSLLRVAGLTDANLMLIKLALSGLVLLPAALLFGGTLPLASRIYTDSLPHAGEQIGKLYAMNTLGSIAGSLLGGFVLLRLLGTRGSLIAVAAIALAVGGTTLIVRFPGTRRRTAAAAIAAVVFVAALAFLPSQNRILLAAGTWFNPAYYVSGARLDPAPVLRQTVNLFYAEGVNDTVIVNESPTERSFSLSGKILATDAWEDRLSLELLGHLPALVHPGKPDRALNVGLGTGATVGALASHGMSRVEVVELEPRVVEALHLFAHANRNVQANPNVKILIADGRNLLSLRPDKYDIISSDPFDVYMTGAANLYTLEFFRLARNRLEPHGIMTQWIGLAEMQAGDFLSVLATFRNVFPNFTVWFSGTSVVLIGSQERLLLDLDVLRARIAASDASEELAALGIRDPEDVVALLVGDEESLGPLARDSRLSTDDDPFIEYGAARRIFRHSAADSLNLIADHYISDESLLSRVVTRSGSPDRERILALSRARREGLRGTADVVSGRMDDGIAKLRGAVSVSRDPFLADCLVSAMENRSKAAQSAGLLSDATRWLESAHELTPDSVSVLTNLSYLYYMQARFDEARPLIERAYALRPRIPEVVFRLGLVRDQAGDASAGALFRQAVEDAPENATFLAVYAEFLERGGQLDQAESLFRRAAELAPGRVEIRESVAGILAARGRVAEAESECRQVTAELRDSSPCRLILGRALLGRGDLSGAERELLAARGLANGAPEIDFELARVWQRMGRSDEAWRALASSLARGGSALREAAERDPELAKLLSLPGAR